MRWWSANERTNVLNMEVALVVEDGLVAGAELDGVSGPHGRVVLVEEALVRRVGAVVRTLRPASRGGVLGPAVVSHSFFLLNAFFWQPLRVVLALDYWSRERENDKENLTIGEKKI